MNQFVYDEIDCIKSIITPSKTKIRHHKVKEEYVVFVNSNPVSNFFACATMMLAKGVDSVKTHIVYCNNASTDFIDDFLTEVCPDKEENPEKWESFFARITIYNSCEEFYKNYGEFIYDTVRFCTFLNATDNIYSDDLKRKEYLSELEGIFDFAGRFETVKLVHSSLIPEIKPLQGGITSISEREYEFYAAQFENDSPEQFVLDTEELLRKHVKEGLNGVATRVFNLFGSSIPNRHFDELISDIKSSNTINANTAERHNFIGLTNIQYASAVVYFMFTKGKEGNIYNIQQYITTPYDIPLCTYNYFSEHDAKLVCKDSESDNTQYALLCQKKLDAVISPKYKNIDLGHCCYKTILSEIGEEYFDKNYIFRYDGKLDEIKQLEIEMMEEVKRICEKHNIKYFLVGGSLLGAVRHKGFIPWDDDLDFGMLREDYEKFRRVAPAELDSKYAYQSFRTEPNSHYIFDKIRLKDTFFATKFSDMFEIENGLFIDILIYDKTAKSPKLQKMHTEFLRKWTRLINIRWVNRPRKGVAYKFSKRALPIMRLFPIKLYHYIFNSVLKWYKSSSSKWVIDGVGQNIERGAFPIEWVEETVDMQFENTVFPVPKMYDEYLRHWYGEKYMQLLPISTRNSGHILKRIDLGPYITRFGVENTNYHHASKKGELFDFYDDEIIGE